MSAAVAPHAQHRFDAAAMERGCPADQSLGEYVAMLVTNGTGEPGSKDTHRLTGGCGAFPAALAPVDPPSDLAFWYCRIDSRRGTTSYGCGSARRTAASISRRSAVRGRPDGTRMTSRTPSTIQKVLSRKRY